MAYPEGGSTYGVRSREFVIGVGLDRDIIRSIVLPNPIRSTFIYGTHLARFDSSLVTDRPILLSFQANREVFRSPGPSTAQSTHESG
jgi:hypothetical protein